MIIRTRHPPQIAQQLFYLAEYMGAHPCATELYDLAKAEILNGHTLFEEDTCTQSPPSPSLQRLLHSIGVSHEAA